MCTFLGHAAIALPINITVMNKRDNLKIILLSILFAVLPDIDSFGYAAGIKYNSTFGHRGFTHSFIFIAILAFLFNIVFFPKIKIKTKMFFLLFLNFFLIGFAHILLDAMTNGGLGVAIFSPISNARFFLPWRPIEVAAILPQYFFQLGGSMVLAQETLFIVVPSILYFLIYYYILHRKNNY